MLGYSLVRLPDNNYLLSASLTKRSSCKHRKTIDSIAYTNPATFKEVEVMLFCKFKKLAGLSITSLVVGLVFVMALFASSASAHNSHQDHTGACARSTTAVKKGVEDLKYNGVLGQFASEIGIHGFDGSLTKQTNEWLVIGKIAHAVNTHNTGCNGSGGTFGAGIRHLYKGEEVAVKVPAKYGKEACKHLSHKCKPVRIVVNVVFPVSCWNRNRKAKIVVIIGVRPKHHKHKHHKPKKPHKKHQTPAPECSTKSPNAGGGNCSPTIVTVTPKQECEANNHSSTGCTQTTTVITVGTCSNYSSGNSGDTNQGGNCNNGGTETCVGQNNCTTHEEETCVNNSCNVTPPPEEPCGCTPEEPEEPEKPEPPSIKITGKTELNMIPAGKTSGDFYINVYASKSGGVLTVDPGIGSVSSCNSSTPESTITTSVPSGASKECVIFYAPEDGDKPPTMTVTMTANLGSASDEATETFKITYPTRPE
jgi:hypothetical protein